MCTIHFKGILNYLKCGILFFDKYINLVILMIKSDITHHYIANIKWDTITLSLSLLVSVNNIYKRA